MNRNVLLVLVATALGAIAPMSYAADPADANAPSTSGGADLAEIMVTAQRRSERAQDVPITLDHLSSGDLDKAGVRDFRDLQIVVPGLTYGGQGNSPEIAIRGVSSLLSTAGTESPNALYIDGVYQISQSLLNMDLPDIDHIDVLKGPQGTLFGRNATGGAIQIFTKNPSFTPTGDFAVEAGYFTGGGTSRASPATTARAFLAGPLVDGLLAGSISAAYQWVDGYQTQDTTGERTGTIEKETVRGKLLFTPGENAKITLGFFVMDMPNLQGQLLETPFNGLSAASVYPGTNVSTQPYHSSNAPGIDASNFKEYGGTLRGEFDFSAGTLTSLTGNDHSFTHNFNAVSGGDSPACEAAFACIDYDFNPDTNEWSQEFNFASKQFGMTSFVAGLFYYYGDGSQVSTVNPSVVPGGELTQDATFLIRAYAAYGDVTITPTDRLSLLLGVRDGSEKHNDKDLNPADGVAPREATFVSAQPRASVTYKLTDTLNTYFTYSQGFKAGLTGITNTSVDFRPVAPEKIDSYEVGLKYGTGQLTWDAAAFYYDYKNKQEQTFNGLSTIVQNTGPVRIDGLDTDATMKLTDEFTLRYALTWIPTAKYLDFPSASGYSTVRVPAGEPGAGSFLPLLTNAAGTGFDATGDRLIRTPTITWSTTLGYQTHVEGGTVDASATGFYSTQSTSDITGTIRQGGYFTLNGQAGYKWESGWRVGVFGRNLTNKAYIVAGLASADGFLANYAPPREVGLSASYSF